MLVFKSDGREFRHLGNLYAAAGRQAPRAVRLAVKEVGQLARTGMRKGVRSELRGDFHKVAGQVNKRIIGQAVSKGASAEYHITARGVIPLKYFRTVQSPKGINVPGVKKHFILGVGMLPKAFEGTTGHAGTRGNRVKRRATLGERIVIADKGTRRSGGKGARLRTVPGVSVPKAFLSAKPRAEFEKAARELPPRLARLLFAAIEGKLKAHRGSRGR